MEISKFYYACYLLLILLSYSCSAQVLTQNDGFEGNTLTSNVPVNWNNCNDGISSGDTQPGSFNNTMAASQGSTYISLVTRELNPPGTAETAWADLLIPFEKDHCYTFSIDLTLSSQFYANLDFQDYYFNNPCVLQVFGLNGDCNNPQSKELLWTSDTVNYFSWKTNTISVRPLSDTYHKIALRPYFIPATNFKNSALMIDNLQFLQTADVFIHNNGLLLLPSTATGILWYFNGQLIPGENSINIPFMGNGTYTASFFDENGCLVITSENFSINTDEYSIYPNPTNGKVTFEYFSSENSTLKVYVYDDLGKFVVNMDYPAQIGKNKTMLDFSLLATGLYHLKLIRENLPTIDKKLVILMEY